MTKAAINPEDLEIVLDLCDSKIENDEEITGLTFGESQPILDSKISEMDAADQEMVEDALTLYRAVVAIRGAESLESIRNDDLWEAIDAAEFLAEMMGDDLWDGDRQRGAINRIRSAVDAARKGE